MRKPSCRVVRLLAQREVRNSVRGRWFLVGAVSFGLLAVAVAQLGMAGAERWGVSAFDRTAAALLNLVLLFVPLLTLPLGAMSFAGEAEDGTLAYLVAQPVLRIEVLVGKMAGLVASMTLSLALGFGTAALFIGVTGGVGAQTFLSLVLAAWALGAVTVLLGGLLSIVAKTRARSMAAAIATWLVLVFLCDFGVLAVAATRALGPEALFWIASANPLQSSKTLAALSISDRLEILGPVGVQAVHTMGRAGLAAALSGALAVWAGLCLAASALLFRRENLS
jgi:Cu-processing system permease protein